MVRASACLCLCLCLCLCQVSEGQLIRFLLLIYYLFSLFIFRCQKAN